MDRRILKTKKSLHNALIELCAEKDYEKITVKEICDRANTGRVTYYTYYNDKNELLDECLMEARDECLTLFKQRQISVTSDPDHSKTILNLLDSILDIVSRYSAPSFNLLHDSNIQARYFHLICKSLESINAIVGIHFDEGLDRDRIYAFLIMGFWGFIHARPDVDWDEIRDNLHLFAGKVLSSNILAV